ncbi:hypothetical protein CD798_08555 [Bacillaceae bacterium SAOS 7]|nr:hypothetical protein CD798_08555 [Bacillaceae bacterium SAOS 7]
MGYEDEYIITPSGLKRLKKDDLVEFVLQQRAMIRKLIDDLDEEKQENHIQALDDLYFNK